MGVGRLWSTPHIEIYFYIELLYNSCYTDLKFATVHMSSISIKFGKRVKKIRTGKGLSQAKLAKVLGVHPTYISGIERGVRNMSLKNIERLAKALEVPIISLLK